MIRATARLLLISWCVSTFDSKSGRKRCKSSGLLNSSVRPEGTLQKGAEPQQNTVLPLTGSAPYRGRQQFDRGIDVRRDTFHSPIRIHEATLKLVILLFEK
jgi:hypothetical protein